MTKEVSVKNKHSVSGSCWISQLYYHLLIIWFKAVPLLPS